MKVRFLTLIIGAAALAMVTGCEGPEGPMGPAGPAGTDGADGAVGSDGTPGVSGSAECLACHSSDNKYRVTMEYEESGHAQGVAAAYAGGRGGCAMCHSNEGFIEKNWTGEDETADFAFPTRIGCTTCHGWHNETFDIATGPDYALRTNAAVDLLMFRTADLPAQSIDLEDNGNLCVNCHQPRRSWEGYVASDDNLGDGTYDQGSTHFGPHHGPHSTTLMGIGGADVGTTAMPSGPSVHGNLATCITCHMDDDDHGFEPSLDACNTTNCHGSNPKTTLDESSRQLAVAVKFEELEAALMSAGLLYYAKDTIYEAHPSHEIAAIDSAISQKKGIYPVGHVGALYNYEWVLDDRSNGLHNFAFVEALLDKSLEALE